MTHYHNSTDSKRLTTSNVTGAIVSIASTRRGPTTTSTSASDMSNVNSGSDEGEMKDKSTKARSLQTGSIPGSLHVTSAVPLAMALTLQQCAHAALPVITL